MKIIIPIYCRIFIRFFFFYKLRFAFFCIIFRTDKLLKLFKACSLTFLASFKVYIWKYKIFHYVSLANDDRILCDSVAIIKILYWWIFEIITLRILKETTIKVIRLFYGCEIVTFFVFNTKFSTIIDAMSRFFIERAASGSNLFGFYAIISIILNNLRPLCWSSYLMHNYRGHKTKLFHNYLNNKVMTYQ